MQIRMEMLMCKSVQACIIFVVYRGLAYASAQQKSYSSFHICVEIVMLFTFILLCILIVDIIFLLH